jgi:hypothetical protein
MAYVGRMYRAVADTRVKMAGSSRVTPMLRCGSPEPTTARLTVVHVDASGGRPPELVLGVPNSPHDDPTPVL